MSNLAKETFSNEMTILKALAIMLVVSGHLEFSLLGIFPPYSFQLALFFFISGCLFKDKYLNDVKTFIKRRVQSLLIPYFWYNLFYLGVTILIAKLTGKFWGTDTSLKNFFITPFLNGHQYDLSCCLWFVIQLFITMVVFLFSLKLLNKITKNKIVHLVIFALIGIMAIPFQKMFNVTPLMLILIRTMFSMFFVYLGYFYVQNIKDKVDIFNPKWFMGVVVAQSILWMFNRDYDPTHGIGLSYVLVWARFDEQLIVPIFTSLTGIWASLFLVKLTYPYIKDVKFIQDMGNTTYHIMANHLLVMFIITAIFMHFNNIPFSTRAQHNIYWIYNPIQTTYLYFILTMIITVKIGLAQKWLYKKLFKKEAK